MSIASLIRPPPLWVPSPAGGSSPYAAKAVHFDGSASLGIPSLTALSNGFCSYVIWLKASGAGPYDGVPFVVNPDIDYSSEQAIGAAADGGKLTTSFQNVDSSKTLSARDDNISCFGSWRCIIVTASTNLGAGLKIIKIYFGDTDATDVVSDPSAAFVMDFNGLPFYVASDSFSNYIGDAADWRIMPGISLLTGSDISEVTRRLFIDADGKPVDPAVATAALGVPCILFSGDSSTFPVNQGTGGAFTLTGSLTNASSSPSD